MGKEYYLTLAPDKNRPFSVPSGWQVLHFLESGETSPVPPVGTMTRQALDKPIAVFDLKSRIADAKSVTVIVDDATRPTPVAEVLAVLLPFIEECGCPKDRVTLVTALGTHVAMEKDVLEARLGKEVVASYRIVQHDAWQADLVPVQLEDGTEVKINPTIAASDFRIGVSSILPHPMAGYGGGPKLLMPGVCNIDFIRGHHMRHGIHERARLGLLKSNPFHEACMGIARAIGLHLTIDCVYDRQGRIASIVAGSLEATYAEAVRLCFEKLGHRFPEKVDISITSSYPHTHGIQIYKGVAAPDIITREGGAVLLMAPMVAPIPDDFIQSYARVKELSHGDPIKYVTDAMSKGLPFLPDKSAEFNMAMSYAIRRSRMRTIVVSPMISRETAEVLGLEYAASFEEGLKVLEADYPEARAAIFPTGGLIVPIVGWE